jgi:hypothetical protein
MTSDNPHQASRTALDEATRRAHAASLDRLSPRVQAQLAQRRRAALAQDSRPASVRAWPMLALGSAAALTLAVGLFVMRGSDDAGLPTTSATVATAPTHNNTTTPPVDPGATTHTAAAPAVDSTDAPDATVDSDAVESMFIDDDVLPAELLAAEFDTVDQAVGFDALQENPDFYLWLGSQDAQADVTESL